MGGRKHPLQRKPKSRGHEPRLFEDSGELLSLAGLGVAWFDSEGRILRMNTCFRQMLGYSQRALSSKTVVELLVPAQREAWPGILGKIRRRASKRLPCQWLRKKGQPLPTEATFCSWQQAGHSRPCLQVVVRDLSESQRREKELAAAQAQVEVLSETRYFQQAILDAIPINLAVLDERANIVSVNGAWRRFAATNGFHGEKLGLGMNYLEVCQTASARTDASASQVAQALRRMLKGRREEFTLEYPCHAPWEERWFILRLIPFSYTGKLRIMAAHMDVTQLIQIEKSLEEARTLLSAHAGELERRIDKRTAELRSTIRSLEGVLYHMAHDLRGPLRAMEGFTSLLLQRYQDTFDEAARDYAGRIVTGAKRMDALIDDLLNFGKVCVVDMPHAYVNLNTIIERVLRRHQAQTENAQAVLEVHRPLPRVWGNEWALEQAFFQLLSNALKFVAPGVSPRIRIWAEVKNTVARVWVEDNGVGIPAEHCERVFRIFERLESDSSSTGIGLAIVRKAVERLDGRAGVQSALGHGSRFWLELPRAPQGG